MVDIGVRLAFTTILAVILLVFVVFWELGSIPLGPAWLGTYVYIPILAYLISFFLALAIQKLSCGKVDAGAQAKNAITLPISYFVLLGILYGLPKLRYPVEGLIPQYDPLVRRAVSSGFYLVLLSYLAQESVNKAAMNCP
jgi:hypothetical protein